MNKKTEEAFKEKYKQLINNVEDEGNDGCPFCKRFEICKGCPLRDNRICGLYHLFITKVGGYPKALPKEVYDYLVKILDSDQETIDLTEVNSKMIDFKDKYWREL